MSVTKSRKATDPTDHDEAKCMCLYDCCTCACSKCQGYRDRQWQIESWIKTADRLMTLGLAAPDLSDFLFFLLEDRIKRTVLDSLPTITEFYLSELLRKPIVHQELLKVLENDIIEIAVGVFDGVTKRGGNTRRKSGTQSR